MFERFEKFSYAIAVLHRYLHNITREEMKPYGLKGPHAMYLLVLLRNGEGMTAVELGEACFRNKADVSRSLAEFEEKGLIEREGSAAGAYRARICLTEAGRRAAEGLRERARIAVGAAGRGLTEENRAVFYESLELIASNLCSLSKSGIPKHLNEEDRS